MRVENSIKNIYSGILNQFVTLIITFITRTVFINVLGSVYLGIGGLFTNILNVLSLAELGVGQAITYSLYSAIAKNDEENICKLMDLYKKIYKFIGIFVFILGIVTMPLLKNFINELNNIENLEVIYFLFVFNSASSYFYVYRSSFIIANQKNYIITKITYKNIIITNIVQILFLILTKNYLIYLLIQVSSTILQNLYLSFKCLKLYPFLKNKAKEEISKNEKKKIYSNIKALMIYKVGSISLNSTDNIIISKFVDIISVGIFSNYNLIITSIGGFVNIIFSSLTASVGNLVSKESKEKSEFIFDVIYFASFWIYGVISIVLFIILGDFIILWLGDKYIMDKFSVFVLVLNFYLGGLLFAPYTYRQTLGLFQYGKFRPVISAILNILLSVILVKIYGIVGVFIATVVTRLATNIWFDPYIIYKKAFKKPLKLYFKKYFKYGITTLFYGIISYYICSMIQLVGFMGLLLKIFICLILSNFINLIIYRKSKEYIYIRDKLRKIIFCEKEKVGGV